MKKEIIQTILNDIEDLKDENKKLHIKIRKLTNVEGKARKRLYNKKLFMFIAISIITPLVVFAAISDSITIFKPGTVISSAEINKNFQELIKRSLELDETTGGLKYDGTITASFISGIFKDRVKDKTGYVMPVGSIIPYGASIAPEGWLICDGSEISRDTYSDLYNVIGNAFGQGNGNSTFHIPDLRGRFIRGLNNGKNSGDFDPNASIRTAMNNGGNTGDAVGSVQTDDLKEHSHNLYVRLDAASGGDGRNSVNTSYTLYGGFISSTGGDETRPKNAYLNFIIKH